jgi:N-acetylneuraminate synthase
MTAGPGPTDRVYVIAEAGVNHNGDMTLARALIDAAAAAGADAVKFQTFKAERLVSETAPKAAYQKAATPTGETQFAMLKRLELSPESHHGLVEHCEKQRIDFLSSPFDLESLRFLLEDLRLETIKIPSGEITNGPLLLAAGRSGRRIILSTGMSTLDEIEEALGVLAFGFSGSGSDPSRQAFRSALATPAGKVALRDRVILLHCTSEYPAPLGDINLRAMETMRRTFDLPIGLSDHTEGILADIAATALGAAVIEKHFTMDRTLPGPDHRASLEPGELADMVAAVRSVGQALGDGVKVPAPSEGANREIVRKSLIATRPIGTGEPFTEENLGARRPGGGASPMEYWARLGRRATRDLAAGEQV